MNIKSLSHPLKVWLIQPLSAPYWSDRIQNLGARPDIELTVFLERRALSSHVAFPEHEMLGTKVRILNSLLVKIKLRSQRWGFSNTYLWMIPYRLVFKIRREKPDVVIVCNATQVIFAFLGRMFSRTRILLMVEDTPHAASSVGVIRRAAKAVAYSLADAWTAFSQDSIEYLARLPFQRATSYAPWSIDRQSLGARGSKKSDRIRIVFVGQLIERKGIDLLISAWMKMPVKVRKSAELHIIGDGPLKSELHFFTVKNRLKEVTFRGQLAHSAVQTELAIADLFVFPTLEDLYGIALLEAVANGCAIITTPFAGGRELVSDGNGWIVDPREIGTFSEILEFAINNPSTLARMAEASSLIATQLGTEQAVDKLLEAINHCKAA